MAKLTFIREVMKIKITVIILLLSTPALSSYVWTQRASFPGAARFEAASFAIGTNGYISCGIGFSNTKYNDCWEWNSVANIWTQKASLPSSVRYGCGGFSLNGKGYVVCGWISNQSQLNQLWEFDPIINVWIQKADYPGIGRYTTTIFTINNLAYVGLGFSPYNSKFYKYDGVSDIWTQIANFPGIPRQNASGLSLNGKGYVIGGHVDPNTDYYDCYEYDPVTDTWTQKADFTSFARFGATEFVFNNTAFFGMGGTYQTNYNDFYSYDPVNDIWTSITSLPSTSRKSTCSFSIGNAGYVYGGNLMNNMLSNDLWELSEVSSTTELSEKISIKPFPNPCSTEFAFNTSGYYQQGAQLFIYTSDGKLIQKADLTAGVNVIKLKSEISTGTYHATYIQQDFKTTFKLVVMR